MIVIETDIESGLVSVDLRPYDIVMENDFLVAIEWIEDLGIGDLFSQQVFLDPVSMPEPPVRANGQRWEFPLWE